MGVKPVTVITFVPFLTVSHRVMVSDVAKMAAKSVTAIIRVLQLPAPLGVVQRKITGDVSCVTVRILVRIKFVLRVVRRRKIAGDVSCVTVKILVR